MVLALSTSWNAFRHTDGNSLIDEIEKLGFNEVELSFNLTSQMVDAVEQAVKDGRISVTSVHNYCPIPPDIERSKALPDCYAMSSRDEGQRRRAVELTRGTIDTAVRLNASAVVLHCGRVEIPDRTVELIALFNKGLAANPEFTSLRDDIIRERARFKQPFLDNTLRSMDELNRYALHRKVKLGVENRYYFREIPFFEETGVILDKFRDSAVFYWHDTGHAQLMQNLGFLKDHEDLLRKYAGRMLGIHLHDITGCSDHQPPGAGELDFAKIKPYIGPGTLTVIEAHHPAEAGQLIKAREFLRGIFNG
ncbi:MAG TPA: sugar phosphate isomerase/epimerase [Candidatus Omnitrophota bacterium]|nr:sugar phosphate isomerase/epimerase [Candidatus Omnitrophota bacterium]